MGKNFLEKSWKTSCTHLEGVINMCQHWKEMRKTENNRPFELLEPSPPPGSKPQFEENRPDSPFPSGSNAPTEENRPVSPSPSGSNAPSEGNRAVSPSPSGSKPPTEEVQPGSSSQFGTKRPPQETPCSSDSVIKRLRFDTDFSSDNTNNSVDESVSNGDQ